MQDTLVWQHSLRMPCATPRRIRAEDRLEHRVRPHLVERSLEKLERRAQKLRRNAAIVPLADIIGFYTGIQSVLASGCDAELSREYRTRVRDLRAFGDALMRVAMNRSIRQDMHVQTLQKEIVYLRGRVRDQEARIPRCRVCLLDDADVVAIYPCMHVCCCAPCCSAMSTCPVCHTMIEASEKVFLS